MATHQELCDELINKCVSELGVNNVVYGTNFKFNYGELHGDVDFFIIDNLTEELRIYEVKQSYSRKTYSKAKKQLSKGVLALSMKFHFKTYRKFFVTNAACGGILIEEIIPLGKVVQSAEFSNKNPFENFDRNKHVNQNDTV